MGDIFKLLLTTDNVVKYWEETRKDRPPFKSEMFFPRRKQLGLNFSFIKGKGGLPIALVASNFDVDVLYRDRIGVEETLGELPFFKEAYKITEKLRQDIITTRDEYRSYLLTNVFDGTNDLIDGAEVTPNIMRNQLLSLGTIAISENGVAKEYNYGFDQSKQLKTVTTSWTDAGADPIADILKYKREYKNLTHMEAKYLYANESLMDQLLTNAKIVEHFNKLPVPEYATLEKVTAYIESVTGLMIVLDNAEYISARDTTKTPKYYYPENRFTLLGTLDLGETLYGTTPEEIDLMNSSAVNSCRVINTGVAITSWDEVDPVHTIIKASEVVAPTCPNIDKIFIVKTVK